MRLDRARALLRRGKPLYRKRPKCGKVIEYPNSRAPPYPVPNDGRLWHEGPLIPPGTTGLSVGGRGRIRKGDVVVRDGERTFWTFPDGSRREMKGVKGEEVAWGEASEAGRRLVERLKAPTRKMIKGFTDLVGKIKACRPTYPRGWKEPTRWSAPQVSRTYPRHLLREIVTLPTIHEVIGLSYPTGPDPPVGLL